MGCMGMSLEDFCLCTPSELKSIFESWKKREEAALHQAWERTRTETVLVMSMMAGKQLDMRKVMPFDWDDKPLPFRPAARSSIERVKELKERIKNNR